MSKNERQVLLDEDGYQLEVRADCGCNVINLYITPTSAEPAIFTIDPQKADLTVQWIQRQVAGALDELAEAQREED